MRKFVLFIVLLNIHSLLHAQVWDWVKPEHNGNTESGSTLNAREADVAHDLETDASGNVYVLANFKDTLYLNGNFITRGNGSYLAKYNNAGNLLWYKLFLSNDAPNDINRGSIQATDLTINSQGIFIVGKYQPSTWYCSYDCQQGTFGNCALKSYSIGDITFTSQQNEAGYFVTKFDNNGLITWNHLATSSYCANQVPVYGGFGGNSDYNPLVSSDNNGNIICEFLYPGNLNNSISFGSENITIPPPINSFYFLVFKMNASGVMQWSNYGSYAQNGAVIIDCNSMVTDNDGNVFLYGRANDNSQFGALNYRTSILSPDNPVHRPFSNFIAKISSTGQWQFAREISPYSQTELAGLSGGEGNGDYLAVDNANNIYAIVNVQGNPSLGGIIMSDTVPSIKTGAYLVKLDNAGNLLWHKGFGTIDSYTNSIYCANNSLYISGGIRNYTPNYAWYFSNLTVVPALPSNGGPFEYFVTKASLNGDFQWVNTFGGSSSYCEGLGVRSFADNVYTCGYYTDQLSSLGNLYSGFEDQNPSMPNIFFGKLKDQYVHVGALPETCLHTGSVISIPFTSFGLQFSGSNTFTAQLSDAHGNFDNSTDIGSTTSTGSGVITATIPLVNLQNGSTGFLVRIKSSDLLNTGFPYYAYADTNYVISLGQKNYYQDLDQDGFGNNAVSINSCTQPEGYVEDNTDCNDNDPAVHAAPVITNTSTTPSNGNDGTITITSPDATEYSKNGTTYQASNVFTGLAAGTYTVYARNGTSCVSMAGSVLVPPGSGCVRPSITAITGTLNMCTNMVNNAVYTAVFTGTPANFTWTVSGATIIGNTSGNSIEVQFGIATTATISVVANASCGNSSVKKITVSSRLPTTPSTIASSSADICKSMSSVTYSISNAPGALLYKWAVPAGCTILSPSSVISGTNNDTIVTNSNTIQVAFPADYLTGFIKVSSMNDCGQSSFRSLTVRKLVPARPATPILTGEVAASICSNFNDLTLSIKQVPNADGYAWKLPAGCVLTGIRYDNSYSAITADSVIVTANPGSTDSISITVSLTGNSSFTTGSVKVYSFRNCGRYEQSAAATISLRKTLPAAVMALLPVTNYNACADYLQNNIVEYTLTKNLSGIRPTGYDWFVEGNGVSIAYVGTSANNTVLPPGTTAAESDSATLTIGVRLSASGTSTPARSVSVRPKRFCSYVAGSVKKNAIQITGIVPTIIGPASTCVGENVTFTAVSGNSNINSFTWTKPSNSVLISGSLTGVDNSSITLRFTTSVAGKVIVKSNSGCGTSATTTLNIAVSQGCGSNLREFASNGTEINKTTEKNATVYPNPNNGNYHLHVESANKKDNANVQVINMFGQVVRELKGINIAGIIDIKVVEDKMPAGNYFIRYQVGNEKGFVKMVIQ